MLSRRLQPPTWREAWQQALYGPDGFFLRSRPGEHFRTSVHASPLFAQAMLTLAHRHGCDTVVDVGAGGGELLAQLHQLDSSLTLIGVDLAPRPPDLPVEVRWQRGLPHRISGLAVANEWLDNICCDVVEVDDDGVRRVVHVDPTTGAETLGAPVDPRGDEWLTRWWPLTEPGTRAEIGRPRDTAWADLAARIDRGLAVAIDYGHTRDARPAYGSMRGYRDGSEVEVVPDGTRDVTAAVAFDSLAAAVGGNLARQRDVLRELGVSGRRPSLDLATTDPGHYVRSLAQATRAAELIASPGLGDFRWLTAHRR